MDRIAQAFAAAKAQNKACFIAYMCAGDPDYETSLNICRRLFAEGVDILELGVPFSDPLADGLTNQLAAQRALEEGIDQAAVFRLVSELRTEFPEKPIVFYTYYNLVYSQGIDAYMARAKEAGLDAILTLDLPPEEADDMLAASKRYGIHNIFIVAPTTPLERIQKITVSASGFIYYVSREGVTGERAQLATNIEEAVSQIKSQTDLPVVVGFGVSKPDQVRSISKIADGVVVGSALVNCIPQVGKNRSAAPDAVGKKMKYLLS